MTLLQRIWRWSQDGMRKVWFEYAGLALLILLPLLLPGYILTLDLVFTLHYSWPSELTNAYPMQVLLWLAYQLLPGDVVEKLLLFGILLFSGAGMHLLFRSMAARTTRAWEVATYFAGLLYMINPFSYARLMAGQWTVLLGYALLPFFVRAMVQLLARPSWRQGLVVGAWAFGITTVSIHHSGMLVVLGGIILAAGLCVSRQHKKTAAVLKASLFAAAFWMVLSSFWLIPTLVSDTSIRRAVEGFNGVHFDAFATYGSNVLGTFGNVLRLQGFWAEQQQLFLLPQQVVPGWGLAVLLLWMLVGAGIRLAWRKNKMALSIGVGSIVLGAVVAATPVMSWLGMIVPFMNGYREPHKFVNLVVLGYAILGGYGAVYLQQRWQQRDRMRRAMMAGVFLLPIVITPVFFGGFAGQLKPREYPVGWQQANQYVKERIGSGRALFLPWHQYARYSFSGRTIANPAAKYFAFPTIVSGDPEFKNIPPTVLNNETADIQTLLKYTPEQLSEYLRNHNVRFVLLAKEQEYEQHAFLRTSGYAPRLENDAIIVYEVQK